MNEGEHTIITKIPRERLNQIASRKLAALAIPVRLGSDRETLEGELAFAGLRHPSTGQAIAKARFAVEGHDRLRFLDPPLAALAPVSFFDAERAAALELQVAGALQKRAAALQGISARLRALRLDSAVEPERLAVRAVVRATTHAFEILGEPEGVRVSRVAPVGGTPYEVDPSFPRLRLEEYPSLIDLETFLVHSLDSMRRRAEPEPRPAPAAAPSAPVPRAFEPMPPPRNSVTVKALEAAFGGDAVLAPSAPVELFAEFEHGGTRYRFAAARESGTTFRGRLIGPRGDAWADRFDLASFPGIRQVVGAVLGAGGAAPGEIPVAADPGTAHLVPRPGEVWVMRVVVEQASDDEVRYVGTDADGRPYGAARVLKRADFEAVFTQDRGSWKLLVAVEQLQGDSAIYRQLDRQRQPVGPPRRMPTAILQANFVPEAADY